MEITSMNYESYALDYAEGLLEGEELAAMEAYLSQHPGLKEELLMLLQVQLPATSVSYAGKGELKRKRKAVAWLPLALGGSIAASLMLALGLLWTLMGQAPDGELAVTRQISLTIQAPVRVAVPSAPVTKAESAAVVASNTVNAGQPVVSGINVAAETGDALVTPATADVPVEPGVVPVIFKIKTVNSYVLPVTLEHYELAVTGAEHLEREMAADDARSSRKSALKEGALSILQNTLMPSGLADLISN